jgi:hypothetical protein
LLTYMTREKYGASLADLPTPQLHQVLEHSMLIFDHLTGVKLLANANHPTIKMWEGYEFALGIYAMMGNMEWTFKRGYADHKYMMFFYRAIKEMQSDDPEFTYECPPWLGDSAVILSHRSNLVRRGAPKVWNNCPPNLPYIWPVINDTPEGYALFISRADKERVKKRERAITDKALVKRIVNWP